MYLTYPVIKLNPGRDKSVRRLHPWIFSGAIAVLPADLADGAIVEVQDENNKFLAVAFYSPSSLALKVISFQKEVIGLDFFVKRLTAARSSRTALGLPDPITDAFRIVHAEGDLLPGLIIDLYRRSLSVQLHARGMLMVKEVLIEALRKVFGDAIDVMYVRDLTGEKEETLGEVAWHRGGWEKPNEILILENSNTYVVDIEQGQKTGFFLDQRENRKRVGSYVADRKVLNCFCYSGGFSVAALRGGALHVDSVDASESALELCRRNLTLNFPEYQGEVRRADCFKLLHELKRGEYDCIILDPPAFAKHRGAIEEGARGYETINFAALQALPPAGLLATFSCSQHIDRSRFLEIVSRAAARSSRVVQVVDQFHQAPCHPWSLQHPEGEYLKGFLLKVV